MIIFKIPVVCPRSWTWTLLLFMIGVFCFVAQVSPRVTWICPLVIHYSPDPFHDGATARDCVAWCHWTVCPSAFCSGARRPILGSGTIFTVGPRRCHHYIFRYLCCCEWLSSCRLLQALHAYSATGSWQSKSRRTSLEEGSSAKSLSFRKI
jgi:hypothetical protein